MNHRLPLFLAASAAFAAGCGTPEGVETVPASIQRQPGRVVAVVDTTINAAFDAAGVAEPIAQATLSTKLMGTVTAVLVREGSQVSAGQMLVRIDARDLAARQSQAGAGIAEAEAVRRDAITQAARIRSLYADSAATRAQLDAAETGLARAEAAVRQARAGASELAAVVGYSAIRAPFAGVVTQLFVDPGAFAAPGTPLVTVQDGRRLRVVATVAPDVARSLRRGASVAATVEGRPTLARIEGIVPAGGGNNYTVNAVVDNRGALFLPGSVATLSLPLGTRRTVVVPSAAVRREGDLTAVWLRRAGGDELRMVRVGVTAGDQIEVLGGLRAGDQVIVPGGSRGPRRAVVAGSN